MHELAKLYFRADIVAVNVRNFLVNIVKKSFTENKQLICERVIVSKEDKEAVTKSKINVLTEYFGLLNLGLQQLQMYSQEDRYNHAMAQWIY